MGPKTPPGAFPPGLGASPLIPPPVKVVAAVGKLEDTVKDEVIVDELGTVPFPDPEEVVFDVLLPEEAGGTADDTNVTSSVLCWPDTLTTDVNTVVNG